MKDNKTERLEIRLTPKEKEQIRDYADRYDMSLSEFIRFACYKIFALEDDTK